MPPMWWSDYCQNSNGYLGSDITKVNGAVVGFSTWAYVETKHLNPDMRYRWYKINIFIRWSAPTRQTTIIAFDAVSPILERIPDSLQNPDPSSFRDPFWVYARLAADVVEFQDSAVWSIRNQVRSIEKEIPNGKPRPDYRHLHDIARHAIHVSETLDVVTETFKGILAQHDDFLGRRGPCQPVEDDVSEGIQRQLRFCLDMIGSLRYRSISNRERLQNEIQLAFNSVAQYDAGITVDIGRASQTDSAAMKTIAYVTMTFLPATFISALFSMSFFDFDAEANVWSMSSKFWVYWACAIPTTLATFILWQFWHKVFPLRPVA